MINDMLDNMAKHVHSQIENSFNAILEYDENKAKKALEMGLTIVVESEGLDPTGLEEVKRCIEFLKEEDKKG